MGPYNNVQKKRFLPIKDCEDMDDPEADPEDEEGNGSARRKQVRHLVLPKQNSHP